MCCVKTLTSTLIKRQTHILETPSQKSRCFSGIIRLIYVNFGTFRHRNRNDLEKMTKKKKVVGAYRIGWPRLIPPHNIPSSSYFRIFCHGVYSSPHFVCNDQLLQLCEELNSFMFQTTQWFWPNFQKLFATRNFSLLCPHKNAWKISQVSNITDLH